MATTKSQVPAADQALRILSYLAHQRGPVPAATLATALGLPRSTVYHLLGVLQERGFVVHLPEERRYGLGVAAFELSSGFSRQQPLARLGRPLVAALVDRLGESAHLAVLHGRDVLYLVEERAPRRPSLVTDVGVRLPAHLTASGRALLSALPAAQVRALYPGASAFVAWGGSSGSGAAAGLASGAGGGSGAGSGAGAGSWAGGGSGVGGVHPSTPRELRAVLEGVRSSGYAVEDGEITPGLASVAVVVRDHAGWPAAGIAVTFPREVVAVEEWPALAASIAETAAELSRRIRGQGRA